MPGAESSSTQEAANEHVSQDEDHALDENDVSINDDAADGEVDHGSAVTEEPPKDPGYVPNTSSLHLLLDDDEDLGGFFDDDDDLRNYLLKNSDGCDVSGSDFRTSFNVLITLKIKMFDTISLFIMDLNYVVYWNVWYTFALLKA